MPKMTIAQARKMLEGTLKGDSAMAQAIKEKMGDVAMATEPGAAGAGYKPADLVEGERGTRTIRQLRNQEEAF